MRQLALAVIATFVVGCNSDRGKSPDNNVSGATNKTTAETQSVLAAVLENGQWGFIDRDGNYAFDGRWPQVRNFSSGLAAVNVGGQRGAVPGGSIGGHFEYIDATGKVVVKGPFPNPGIYWRGLLVTLLGPGDAAVIDRKGTVIAHGFSDLRGFSGGLSYAVKGQKSGFIGPDGTWRFELPRGAKAGLFHDGLVVFSPDGKKWGFLDDRGKTAIAPQFEDADQFWQGRAAVKRGGKWGYVDAAGKLVVAAEWDSAGLCSDDRCAVSRGGLWGFVDLAGKVVIPPKYKVIRDFSDGLAAVLSDGKVGYIDPSGAWVIKPQFAAAYDFNFGRAAFVKDQKLGFIDRTGKPAIAPRFTKANRFVDVNLSNDTDRSE